MALARSSSWGEVYYFSALKSFAIWTFTLIVCLLVVGFPLVALMSSVGVLLAIALQSVMSVSAVLLVAGALIGLNLLAVIAAAAILTLKGVHPQEVRWLHWLHGDAETAQAPVYASCPLTCEVKF